MRLVNSCLLGLGVFLVGCSEADRSSTLTSDDVKKEVSEAVMTTKDFAANKKDQVAEELRNKKDQIADELKKKLEGLDAQIAELESKGAELKEDAKAQWDEQLAKLKEKRAQAGEKFEALKGASDEAWEELKSGFESAWTELKQAYDDAAQEFE